MTTEEKAKAYDAALERAKKLENTTAEEEALIEYIFPVLRESEDERIRKELVDFVNHYRHNTDLTTEQAEWCKKAIAYLGKQKEPENVSASTMAPACWEVELKKQEVGHLHPEDYPMTPEECIKPAEWSEEDELTIADLINYFEGDSLECSTEEMVQRIKSLRPSWKPSEKQMMKEAVEGVAGDSKQKNSEYDEKYLNFILDLLEDQKKFCKKNAEGARYSKEISSAQTWLKNKFK